MEHSVNYKSWKVLLFAVALVASGCISQTQFLDSKQSIALTTAVGRGQFEMNCPSATGEVISKEVVQPVMQGAFAGGVTRAEFTVGVAGCDKRHVYVVICPDGSEGCFAAGPGGFLRRQNGQ